MAGGSKKKVRIELEDAEGGRYNLSLEGNISKQKIMKIVEFMDLLNIESPSDENGTPRKILNSVGSKIWNVVENKFPFGNFTSSDILEIYEDQYNEPVRLSIISTYLSRYSERGILIRNRQGKEWIYKISRQAPATQQPLEAPSAEFDQYQ